MRKEQEEEAPEGIRRVMRMKEKDAEVEEDE